MSFVCNLFCYFYFSLQLHFSFFIVFHIIFYRHLKAAASHCSCSWYLFSSFAFVFFLYFFLFRRTLSNMPSGFCYPLQSLLLLALIPLDSPPLACDTHWWRLNNFYDQVQLSCCQISALKKNVNAVNSSVLWISSPFSGLIRWMDY